MHRPDSTRFLLLAAFVPVLSAAATPEEVGFGIAAVTVPSYLQEQGDGWEREWNYDSTEAAETRAFAFRDSAGDTLVVLRIDEVALGERNTGSETTLMKYLVRSLETPGGTVEQKTSRRDEQTLSARVTGQVGATSYQLAAFAGVHRGTRTLTSWSVHCLHRGAPAADPCHDVVDSFRIARPETLAPLSSVNTHRLAPWLPHVGTLGVLAFLSVLALVGLGESSAARRLLWRRRSPHVPLPCPRCATDRVPRWTGRTHGVGIALAVFGLLAAGRQLLGLVRLAGPQYEDSSIAAVLPFLFAETLGPLFLLAAGAPLLLAGDLELRCPDCDAMRWCETCKKVRPISHACGSPDSYPTTVPADTARRRARGAGTFLALAGTTGFVLQTPAVLLWAFAGLSGAASQGASADDRVFYLGYAGFWTFAALAVALLNAYLVWSGMQMRRCERRPFVIAGGILALIPCVGCIPIAIPAGLYALFVLRDPAVAAAFRATTEPDVGSAPATPPA